MALTAARSDLTISVVGEDETQKMLAEAQANMAALEGKIKSLQRAGKAQAVTAHAQTDALKSTNAALTGFSKKAEGAIEGVDKAKSAFEKWRGAALFVGGALGGVAIALNDVLGGVIDFQGEAGRLFEKMRAAGEEANAFAKNIFGLSQQLQQAAAKTASLRTQTFELAKEQALLSGNKSLADAIDKATKLTVQEERRAKSIGEHAAAVDEVTKSEQKLADLRKKMTDSALGTSALGGLAGFAGDVAGIKDASGAIKDLGAEQQKQLAGALALETKRNAELRAQESLLRGVANQTADIVDTRRALAEQGIDADKLLEPDSGAAKGGAKASVKAAEDTSSKLAKIADAARREEVAQNKAFSDFVLAQIDARREAELLAIKEVEDARKRAAEAAKEAAEAARQMRLDETQPVYDFADALTSSLVPALGEVGTVMSAITAQFDKFREGQASLTEALAGGATEIAAFAAKSIGGVKAEAAVRAVYEGAMGFATLANPVISAGHFTAAAMLTGVATGVIGSGSGAGAGGEKKRGIPRAENTQQGRNESNGGTKTVVINTMFGDRQSIAAGIRQADRSTRGTGYTRGVGV